MNQTRLVIQSLIHHWRTNLAMVLGVVAGTAVIGGALIVGDSVKASLRQMTLDRLGKIDEALSGPRFFREDLADRLSASVNHGTTSVDSKKKIVSPAIIMRAGLQARKGENVRRAGQVNVYGFDARAWSLMETGGLESPKESGVVLNAQAAHAIDAHVGDEVTLWIELPSAVPRDTLMGKKDNDSQEITLTVSGIASDSTGLARLGLQPTQAYPLNSFVDLHFLQAQLDLDRVKPSRRDPVGKPSRVNTLLIHDEDAKTNTKPTLNSLTTDALRKVWTLSDLNLRLVDNPSINGLVLESDQMILENNLAAAAIKTAANSNLVAAPVMVYLANKLWNPAVYEPGKRPGYSMYSTVAGIEFSDLNRGPFKDFSFIGDAPKSLDENEVIINQFLAADLEAKVGDQIKFTYHTVGSRGELPELEETVTVRGIVAMSGAAIDRTLTPEVKGITDVDSLADWDQPFPMDLNAVTPRDDEYWNDFRATPKMFLPLQTAKKLWPSRYGSLTSLRLVAAADEPTNLKALHEKFAGELLGDVAPVEVNMAVQPVKAIGLLAANGSTDFSGLFFGFSLFLIVAAMILIGLLFRLGIEQRVRDLGLLGAIGFTSGQIRQQMLFEGTATAVTGGLLGTVVAVGYAKLMIYGLTHWWVGAIGTSNLILAVQPLSLLTGFAIAVLAAIISIWWALRQLKQLSLREQLAGVTEQTIDWAAQARRTERILRRATISTILAVLLTGTVAIGLIPAAGAFFGIGVLLLVACLSFLSAWLQRKSGFFVHGKGWMGLGRLGLRNASRQRQRTVMSAGMIATATFLIVTVAAFRRDPTSELPIKTSGNGGFTLVAESSSPILYDMNTEHGRQKLRLIPAANSPSAKALDSMKVIPFRVKPGEDASCLNLFQTRVPTILGAPRSLIDDHRFAFASGSWKELAPHPSNTAAANPPSVPATEPPIPVLGDLNTLMFSLHKQVGQTIAIPSDETPQHQLIVKGMFQDSVFQGVLVMADDDFVRLFPEQKGFQYFLIDVPPAESEAASALLETELNEYGFDAEPVAERLARFLSVQNTYLSTFQTLGGLGLLLGTFGLATVMLRNVLERQAEIALLRAVGFHAQGVATLILWENAFIMLWGLAAGAGSALLATAPNLLSRGADLPWVSLMTLLLVVLATGMLASTFAVRAAVRLPIVSTLRGD
ncbi:FtsX-like permease family protein [Schlesneria paludicola]|uniref:FtsX-like permease family protein n=1 Tax=Schlesneria paludicola TaxID=360056 RepID=UPI00029B476F|nr:FtsX-like permease family protein [Schlesneria paludicola]